MSSQSNFTSRYGTATIDNERLYRFLSDMRNFSSVAQKSRIDRWQAEEGSCSFEIPVAGEVRVSLAEARPYNLVSYKGEAFRDTPFVIDIEMENLSPGETGFRIVLNAALNPMLRVAVKGPINEFLGKLVSEIERFDRWDEITEDT